MKESIDGAELEESKSTKILKRIAIFFIGLVVCLGIVAGLMDDSSSNSNKTNSSKSASPF